ncbi:hypothetical protein ACH4S8_09025 [Streptomyces sp. NPDC021080]|uniref:hypothetical protein n=1 Tax=Streptomyces sp. NPDC021080 TaxID=3365110 RepID=UPI0037889798
MHSKGPGNDTISRLAGNDTMNGNAGNDTLDGGLGFDVCTPDTGGPAVNCPWTIAPRPAPLDGRKVPGRAAARSDPLTRCSQPGRVLRDQGGVPQRRR